MIFDTVTNKLFKNLLDGTVAVGNALKLNGLTAEEFVKGVSPHFASGETILDWATNPNGIYKKFIIEGVYPSDAPIQQEGFCELSIDGSKHRKQVKFTPYKINKYPIYERSIFQGAWNTEWTKPNDGGNADTVNGIKLYKSFSEIGSNISKNTPIKDVVNAMAVNSRLVVTVYNPTDGIYPTTNGVLEINKTYASEHTSLKFTAHTGKGFWYGLVQTSGNYWTGWIKNANADEVLPLTGGMLENTVSTILTLLNSNTTAGIARILFKNANGNLGAIGMGATADSGLRRYKADLSGGYTILDTGNSNAVIFTEDSTTAPTDTNALWAHLD